MRRNESKQEVGMSDQQSKENLSAWIDGELDHARASALPNQILESAEMRQSWSEWHLVGDLMRSTGVARRSTLTRRIVEQIEAEPLHHFPKNPQPRYGAGLWSGISGRTRLIYGSAVAAAVAFVAFVALAPQMHEHGFVEVLASAIPESVTLSQRPAPPVLLEDPRLRELLEAHGSMSIRPVSAEVR